MNNIEKEAVSAPVRKRVAMKPVSPQSPIKVDNIKQNEGYHNPKILTLILLGLACLGLICFFLVPVYFNKIEYLGEVEKIKVKLFEALVEKGSGKVASSLMLVGYSVIILNSLVNLWHEKKVNAKLFFVICNFVAVIASLMVLACGFYLIFSLGFTAISLITISIVVALPTIQAIAFLRCKEEKPKKEKPKKEKPKKEKPKKEKKTVKYGKYQNSKKLTVANLMLNLVFAAYLFLIGYAMDSPQLVTVILYISASALLIYQILNNIILLASKRVSSSKYGYVSKVICAILSIIYLLCLFALGGDISFHIIHYILYGILYLLITIISIIQAVKSKPKE